ncbi:ABC transporter substrate-binding protein [Oceanibacterium hippocampi]|uniref:Leucine-specific-binding protein n=1 Tax=Oceanibacterium hippocampi TaxID=745714 RepID=A0A1Y5SPH4_9PROT|nr:ABC transporter substrate-binding protein [Oceanibacterium hippocampi]SLN42376.1 Leucine-specific-binding protein precursor [Oceanibacterium hippocampi]
MKKNLAALVLGASLLTAAHAQAEDVLKLGAPFPLSGPGAAWGTAVLNGVKLAAKDVNEAGGLKVGDTTYKIEVVAYDDKYSASEEVTVVNRLLSVEGVKFFTGPIPSAGLLAVQPMLKKADAVAITLAFTSKAIGPDYPGIFRVSITSHEMAQPQVNWLIKNVGVKKVVGLFENDETGHAMEADTATAYKKAGATYSSEFFERGTVDFVSLLTRVLFKDIDAIELSGMSPTTSGLIIKQARELGFTGKIVRTGGPATQEIVHVAGKEAAEGIVVHAPINPYDEQMAAFIARYEGEYGAGMNGFAPFFYDGTRMMLKAMQDAGTVEDPIAVRDAMAALSEYEGVLGKVSWVGEETYGINRQISVPFYIAEIRDGKEKVVATCNVIVCE